MGVNGDWYHEHGTVRAADLSNDGGWMRLASRPGTGAREAYRKRGHRWELGEPCRRAAVLFALKRHTRLGATDLALWHRSHSVLPPQAGIM